MRPSTTKRERGESRRAPSRPLTQAAAAGPARPAARERRRGPGLLEQCENKSRPRRRVATRPVSARETEGSSESVCSPARVPRAAIATAEPSHCRAPRGVFFARGPSEARRPAPHFRVRAALRGPRARPCPRPGQASASGDPSRLALVSPRRAHWRKAGISSSYQLICVWPPRPTPVTRAGAGRGGAPPGHSLPTPSEPREREGAAGRRAPPGAPALPSHFALCSDQSTRLGPARPGSARSAPSSRPAPPAKVPSILPAPALRPR